MIITVREVKTEDAQIFLEYSQKLLSEQGHNAPFAPGEFSRTLEQQTEILEKFASENNSIAFLAFAGSILVGELNCRGLNRIPLSHVTILSMSVDSQYRGRGIGSKLMEAAMEWAQEADHIKRVELYTFATNKIAQRLYKKFGFNEEGLRKKFVKLQGQYIDDLIMARLF